MCTVILSNGDARPGGRDTLPVPRFDCGGSFPVAVFDLGAEQLNSSRRTLRHCFFSTVPHPFFDLRPTISAAANGTLRRTIRCGGVSRKALYTPCRPQFTKKSASSQQTAAVARLFLRTAPDLGGRLYRAVGSACVFIHDNFILAYENAPGLAGRYAG